MTASGQFPNPRTWTAGENTTADMMNTMSLEQGFLLNPPDVHLYKSSGLSVARDTNTLVIWDTALFQNDHNWHDSTNPTTNTSRLYFNTDGVYTISAGAMWTPTTSSKISSVMTMSLGRNCAGTRPGFDDLNQITTDTQLAPGDGIYHGLQAQYPVPPQHHIDTLAYFQSGEYIEAWVYWYAGASSANRWIPGGPSAQYQFYISAQWTGL